MKQFFQKLVLVLALLIASVASADMDSPMSMLQSVSDRMIVELEQNKATLTKPGVIQNIVDTVLIPHIALSYMGMSVVGRDGWSKANATERSEFIRQFTRLVTSTYSAALASYDGDKVKVFPVRENWQDKRIIQVHTLIVRRSGQKIPVIYNMVKTNQGWLVYDFSIENVSITRSYRAQFAGVLAKSGMPGLLERLRQHNQSKY